MSRITDLEDQLAQLGRSLHALIVARQFAVSTGQTTAADGIAVQIAQTGAAYNGIVAELRTLEGPGATLVLLDKVGDVVIEGVKTGAVGTFTAAGNIVKAAGDAASGIGSLAKALPLIAVGIVVVLAIGFYRGSLGVKLAPPGAAA